VKNRSSGPVRHQETVSTNVARVLVCLEEVGAEYELVPVDMTTGEHKSPAHVACNPFGQVPAFQDGDLILFGEIKTNNNLAHFLLGLIILLTIRTCSVNLTSEGLGGLGEIKTTESRAISRYILRKGGSDLLRDSNLSESAMVDVWLEVESGHFTSAMSPIIFQCFVVPNFLRGQTNSEIVEENLVKLKTCLEVYEARLSKSKYLAGDFVSLTDISHFPGAYFLLRGSHASVLDAYPNAKRWIAEVMNRPSVKKVSELMKMPSA
ncbi:hypothetical protein U9M48_020131, partial [Paspalum notatum var. saurae]